MQISSRHHLSGEQQTGIMSDLRAKWGRQVVTPNLKEVKAEYNQQFAPFFSVAEKQFIGTNDTCLPKHLFYCHNIIGLISELDRLRGVEGENMTNII